MLTSIALILSFHNITFLSWFFFFSFIIDLYLLIPTMIAQIFIPAEELVKPTIIGTYEANAGIETQPVTAKS